MSCKPNTFVKFCRNTHYLSTRTGTLKWGSCCICSLHMWSCLCNFCSSANRLHKKELHWQLLRRIRWGNSTYWLSQGCSWQHNRNIRSFQSCKRSIRNHKLSTWLRCPGGSFRLNTRSCQSNRLRLSCSCRSSRHCCWNMWHRDCCNSHIFSSSKHLPQQTNWLDNNNLTARRGAKYTRGSVEKPIHTSNIGNHKTHTILRLTLRPRRIWMRHSNKRWSCPRLKPSDRSSTLSCLTRSFHTQSRSLHTILRWGNQCLNWHIGWADSSNYRFY